MKSSLKLLVFCATATNVDAFSQTRTSSYLRLRNLPKNQIRNFNERELFESTKRDSRTSLEMSLELRGGARVISTFATKLGATPLSLFNSNLIFLGLTTFLIKIADRMRSNINGAKNISSSKPEAIKSLQIRFLSVFWLLRCADWLQGPYFYEVYSSKIFNGVPASLAIVSRLFLTGFAATAFFGPLVGRASDSKGRKRGTIAFALLYSLGAASTRSNLIEILLLGRVLSGIGTSLLFSAPEAWLVGESSNTQDGMKYLGETFGLVSVKILLF